MYFSRFRHFYLSHFWGDIPFILRPWVNISTPGHAAVRRRWPGCFKCPFLLASAVPVKTPGELATDNTVCHLSRLPSSVRGARCSVCEIMSKGSNCAQLVSLPKTLVYSFRFSTTHSLKKIRSPLAISTQAKLTKRNLTTFLF